MIPKGAPCKGDFKSSQITTKTVENGFKRGSGSGGSNHGRDHKVPKGYVLVSAKPCVKSQIHCKGGPAIGLIMEQKGPFSAPVGIHFGHRLEPDDGPFGSGASFQYKATLKYVPVAVWMKKAAQKVIEQYETAAAPK